MTSSTEVQREITVPLATQPRPNGRRKEKDLSEPLENKSQERVPFPFSKVKASSWPRTTLTLRLCVCVCVKERDGPRNPLSPPTHLAVSRPPCRPLAGASHFWLKHPAAERNGDPQPTSCNALESRPLLDSQPSHSHILRVCAFGVPGPELFMSSLLLSTSDHPLHGRVMSPVVGRWHVRSQGYDLWVS